jgi:outer membrane protein assembly factor BamB
MNAGSVCSAFCLNAMVLVGLASCSASSPAVLVDARGAGGGGGVAVGGGVDAGGDGAQRSFAVVTDRYDNARSASNLAETILTTSNVTPARFGLLFSRSIVGNVYGQPLYVQGVSIDGAPRNVVYVATAHNWIYAFDADAPEPDAPIWSRMLGAPLVLGTGGYNPGCTDMRNEVGITATPVISLAAGKIFVVAKVTGDQQLHALDLATGAEGAGSPVSVGKMAMTAFDPQIHLNRASLLLLNGVIYIAYGSHCDVGAYHGWLFGYDATTLQLVSTYNTTPTGTLGAIWQSGVGLTSDGADVFMTVGNGTSSSGDNMGNNVVRLTPAGAAMTIAAHYQSHVSGDNDLQSGVALLGDSGQLVAGGKDGDILLLGATNLALKQTVARGSELNSFAFWNGSAGPMLFTWPVGEPLYAYQVGVAVLTEKATNSEQTPSHPSSIFTISSNGTVAGTGIVWASMPLVGDAWHATATGGLYAYDAADVSKPSLWNSTIDPKDNVGTFAKYSPPMVANGKVYLATFSGKLLVYGLKP